MLAGLIELALVFGSVLAFGVWQLVSVRRAMRQDEDAEPPRAHDGDRE